MEVLDSVACLETTLKEFPPVERKRMRYEENLKSSKARNTRETVITKVDAKAPACSSAELPILCILSRAPEDGVRTRHVLREVRSAEWFKELGEDDLNARYPTSMKKIVDSVIKYARKNLVLKGEIFPANDRNPIGIWRATPGGLERARKEKSGWSPRYTNHYAVIIKVNG